jgi:hypothetical protein
LNKSNIGTTVPPRRQAVDARESFVDPLVTKAGVEDANPDGFRAKQGVELGAVRHGQVAAEGVPILARRTPPFNGVVGRRARERSLFLRLRGSCAEPTAPVIRLPGD